MGRRGSHQRHLPGYDAGDHHDEQKNIAFILGMIMMTMMIMVTMVTLLIIVFILVRILGMLMMTI